MSQLIQKTENAIQNLREMAKRSKGDASDKDILDVTLVWFMHCNFKAVEIGLMSHYLG